MKVSVETQILDKKIIIDTFMEYEQNRFMPEMRNHISQMIIDTQDKAIEQALFELGYIKLPDNGQSGKDNN